MPLKLSTPCRLQDKLQCCDKLKPTQTKLNYHMHSQLALLRSTTKYVCMQLQLYIMALQVATYVYSQIITVSYKGCIYTYSSNIAFIIIRNQKAQPGQLINITILITYIMFIEFKELQLHVRSCMMLLIHCMANHHHLTRASFGT